MALFHPDQLKKWLHYAQESDFDASEAQLAEQVVAGWLCDAIDVDSLEELGAAVTGSPRFQAWAIELGGIAYENPTSMSQDGAAEVSSQWQLDRRRQILEGVRSWARNRAGAVSGVLAPRGRFPAPAPWPDQGSSTAQGTSGRRSPGWY